jgi:hypothetical protein
MKKSAIILSVLLVMETLACRFNVRDVGFVDLDSSVYKLFLFVPNETPSEDIDSLKSIAFATYLDSNVKAEVLTFGAADEAEIGKFLPRIRDRAQAVLVSPDEKRTVSVEVTSKNQPLSASAWDGLESVFDSPRRNAVLSNVYEHYGVVLIVEGENASENMRIRKMAEAVVKSITGKMDRLEKEISEPPVVEVITAKEFAGEKAFLWSLGITETYETPQVVVLYGRGRIIGPVLRNERLDERALEAIVNTIGLNCECGLDRKWMQGQMIPLKWDDDVQKRIAKQLGFDPESPAIRLEMSQILSKGGKGQGANRQMPIGGTLDELLMGYREGALTAVATTPEEKSLKVTEPLEAVQPKPLPPPPPSPKPQASFSIFGWVLMAGLPVFIVGGLILLLGRKRDS